MKYWIEPINPRKPFYTEKLLKYILTGAGHEIVAGPDACVLVSICDVTEIRRLERIRAEYPDRKIIVGGHFAKIGYKVLSLFADIVWVGHAFEMADCQGWEDIQAHGAAYASGQARPVIQSKTIRWNACPLIQIDKKRFYLWGGVGCRNKCSFCLTSHTEPHLDRPGLPMLMEKSKRSIGSKGSIKIISNAYSIHLGDEMVQDMLLKDFLKLKTNTCRKLVRCGIEFATEATRKKNAKPLRDSEIRIAIKKAEDLNLELHLFMIGGIDALSDWDRFIDVLPPSDKLRPTVYLKWTNLEYQQRTPLWREIKEMDPGRYLDSDITSRIFEKVAHKNKRIRVMRVKYPAHAIWRICMSNATTIEQYRMCKSLMYEKDMTKLLDLMAHIRPWDNILCVS